MINELNDVMIMCFFQDAAFNVRFGLADIQGNLFDTLVGKPFAAFQILSTELRPGSKKKVAVFLSLTINKKY